VYVFEHDIALRGVLYDITQECLPVVLKPELCFEFLDVMGGSNGDVMDKVRNLISSRISATTCLDSELPGLLITGSDGI